MLVLLLLVRPDAPFLQASGLLKLRTGFGNYYHRNLQATMLPILESIGIPGAPFCESMVVT